MQKYLLGAGRQKIPNIVEKHLGNHWYTGIIKNLADTKIGNNLFMHQFIDKTLPKIDGDNSLARQFLNAGGGV